MAVNAVTTGKGLAARIRKRGLRQSLTRALGRVFRIPLTFAASFALRRRIGQVSSLDEALDLAYGFSFCGIVFAPWQERSEIRGLLETVAELQPKAIVEIGTSNGGTLFLFARVAAPDAVLVSVDLPHGDFGGGYPPWRGHLYRAFAGKGQRIELLRADSHRAETVDAVRALLGGRDVDALFIDGDHTYAGVKRDYEMYEGLVRDGGVVAFHDIVPIGGDGPRPKGDLDLQGGEVPGFWRELSERGDVLEFVEDWESGRFGIGAVRVRR
jgi:predicted O-methyltransferase YrrM